MTYGALVLDLAVVWLLLHRRTRVPAFVVATTFHLLNAWLFGLWIFPWLMIASTTLFFAPDWPERVLARLREPRTTASLPLRPALRPRLSPAVVALVALWVVVQVTVPLRHLAIAGSPSWTETGHRFAWHMKLRERPAP
jgi:vitamin K-dependent gamma-carboxylase